MKSNRCLYCYQPLINEETDFHEKCSRKFFGTSTPPSLDYTKGQMLDLAKDIVVRSIAVTGVQPKISLSIEKTKDPKASRFAIVGLWGNFILKPPFDMFPNLPENEDLTMHLSEYFEIPTAEHSLIRLKSGELAYLTKRFDRDKKEKLAMEDMCQLTETLTEDKYRSSMEKVGKHLTKYSDQPGLDLITFFELSLFCFLTGNADMHLKNFALLKTKENNIQLSPAFDLVNTKVAMPADTEEMALTINAKKRKLKKTDFLIMAKTLGISERSTQNSFEKFARLMPGIKQWIDDSFLPPKAKRLYNDVMHSHSERMELL